jgi:hypothetical protein
MSRSNAKKARLTAMKKKIAELRSSPFIKAHDLPIEHGLSSKRQRQSLAQVCERVEGIPVARD